VVFLSLAQFTSKLASLDRRIAVVGFSMDHASPGLFLLGFVFVLLSHGGAVITLVFLLKDRFWQNWEPACLVAGLILIPPLVYVQYDTWLLWMTKAWEPGSCSTLACSASVK
jgi:hypothetical protein